MGGAVGGAVLLAAAIALAAYFILRKHRSSPHSAVAPAALPAAANGATLQENAAAGQVQIKAVTVTAMPVVASSHADP